MARIVFTPMSAEAWALSGKTKSFNGDIVFSQLLDIGTIQGTGDPDTKMVFTTDTIVFTAGNIEMVRLNEVGTNQIIFNNDNTDIDFIIKCDTVTGFNMDGGTAAATFGAGATFAGAITPSGAGGQDLGSAALEWQNLYLDDGGIVYFGLDQDVTLTHVADTGLRLNLELELDGALNHDGANVGFYGIVPVVRSAAWTITNDIADRAFDANTVAVAELADVVATLITDLAATGIIGASA